jgi:acetyl esterase/lipase
MRFLFVATTPVLLVVVTLLASCSGPSTPVAAISAACPQFLPMHGVLPLLFRVGIFKKPPIAQTIAVGDTSSSTVIHPDIEDQIRCGKTPIETIKDITFATPTLRDGKSLPLKMDLLLPTTSKRRRGVVVYIPGGGFVLASKEGALNLRTYVAESGFVVASIEYRTTRNGANYRDGIADVKSAVRYLRKNAARFGIDSSIVAIWGESAGGYLAAMVGVTNHTRAFDAGDDLDQSSEVQGVIDDFGASDISKLAADFDAATQRATYSSEGLVQYIGKSPDADTLDTLVASTAANPITYVRADAPPFLIFHGNQDHLISPSQTLILHNSLLAAGVHSTRYVVEGAGHGDLSFMGDTKSGLPWSTNEVLGHVVDFLNGLSTGPK